METRGLLAPETAREARERYEALGTPAQVMVKEVAKAMEFDSEEYEARVTPAVVETARDALFASMLSVRVGTRGEFEAWCEDHDGYEIEEIGSENVEHVVWHPIPAAGTVVAATYHQEADAAVSTLRRRAFGGVYRDLLEE